MAGTGAYQEAIMKKRWLFLCIGIAFCFTACSQAKQKPAVDRAEQGIEELKPEQAVAEEGPAADGMSGDGENGKEEKIGENETQNQEQNRKQNDQQATAGWQLAEGYGILRPGEPAAYILDDSEGAVRVQEGSDTAELLAAVCQENRLSVRVRIKDYSDGVWEETKSPDGDVKNPGQDVITGKGLPESGVQFNQVSTSQDGDPVQGYVTVISEKSITRDSFTMEPPEGEYELHLAGFSEPLRFSFREAARYGTLEELEGTTVHDGYYVTAAAKKVDDSYCVRVYTCPEEGYSLRPAQCRLYYKLKDGGEVQGTRLGAYGPANRDLFPELPSYSFREYFFTMPEEKLITSCRLELEDNYITSAEQSEVVSIPIPEEHGDLDIKVEFADCTVYLTGVDKLEDRYEYGTDEEGQIMTLPMLTVSASAKNRSADRSLYGLYGLKPKPDGEEEDYYRDVIAWGDFVSEDGTDRGELMSLTVLYEDGDTQASLVFSNPVYAWKQEFSLVFTGKE